MSMMITQARRCGKTNMVREMMESITFDNAMAIVIPSGTKQMVSVFGALDAPFVPQERHKQKPNRPTHRIASPRGGK